MSHWQNSDGAKVLPDFTIASVQMAPRAGQKAGNVERTLERLDEAAANGAQAVVLPELASSGYAFASREHALDAAEAVPSGSTTRAWRDAAQRLNIHVIAGIPERAGDRLYNTAVVIGPEGYIGKYRKLHLRGGERHFFEPGDVGRPVFNTGIGCLAAVISYDGWFPEVYRLFALRGADVVCLPANRVPEPGEPVIGQSLWPRTGPAGVDGDDILYAHRHLDTPRRAAPLNSFNDVLHYRSGDQENT
jgi:predicted amidohydrolase